ncbi:hypothetical protein R69658_07619 [Paraburkholderia aspalathi]|uniref:Transposase IS701-like DDE domain-containing protein n=1 Tax=Paraburkholderia aspalathi TaxID=1324617 RepID=A0ABM8T6D4_9BURK|nr:hypothetical protein R69658_07619 [Paraburkholderia aspalathi]
MHPSVPFRMDQRSAHCRAASLAGKFHCAAVRLHDLARGVGIASRAIAAISGKRHWTTYYKLLVLMVLPACVLTFVLDDTLNMRCSRKAPGVAWPHEHSGKPSRPQYVWAQCIVTLGVSVLGHRGIGMVLPILSRLVPQTGNRNKLKIALALVRALSGVTDRPMRVLFDSWFMRARLVLPLLRRKIHVTGQARIDTALFIPSATPDTPRRGRPRIYGERLNTQAVEALPVIELTTTLYGKEQRVRVRLRSIVARRPLPQGKPGARSLVPDLRRNAAGVAQSASDPDFGTGPAGTGCCSALRVPMGDRAAVSQSQAMVGGQQPLATDAHRAGVVDANPLVRLDAHAIVQLRDCRCVPDGRHRSMAKRSACHRRADLAVAAPGIYRTCRESLRAQQVLGNPATRATVCERIRPMMSLWLCDRLVSSQFPRNHPHRSERAASTRMACECLNFRKFVA